MSSTHIRKWMFLESNVLTMSRNLVMPVLEFYGKNAKSNVDLFAYKRHWNSFSIVPLKIFLIGGNLFYHFVLVSAIQGKLAIIIEYMYIFVYHLLLEPLSPP